MSVLHKLPLRIVFAAALCVAACGDDDSASSEDPATGEDGGQAGRGTNGGSGGKASAAGKGGSGGNGNAGGKAGGAGNGGAGGNSNVGGKDGTGGKAAGGKGGNGNVGGKASAAGSGGATPDGDAGVDLEDAGPSALPQAYKITFSTTECFGRCPVYSVSLDQDGNVAFDGQRNVAQEGKSTKQVAPNAAADVYEALLAADYFGFKDAYRTEADGCERVRTDSPSHNWSVERDGQTKNLLQYLGCEGVPGLDKVEAVSKLLIEKAAVADWIGSNN